VYDLWSCHEGVPHGKGTETVSGNGMSVAVQVTKVSPMGRGLKHKVN